jgi:MFS family permease
MKIGVSGLVLLAVSLAVLNNSDDQWGAPQLLLVVPVLASLALAAAFTPSALSQLADIAESQHEHRGTVLGFYSLLFGAGQTFGALIGGPVVQVFGLNGLILLTGLLTGTAYLALRGLEAEKSKADSRLSSSPRLLTED